MDRRDMELESGRDRYDNRRGRVEIVNKYIPQGKENEFTTRNHSNSAGSLTRERRRSRSRDRRNLKETNLPSSGMPVQNLPRDENLPEMDDDPRIDKLRAVKHVKLKGKGMNTESFDPNSTIVRPDIRIVVGPKREELGRTIKHDDVVIVPEFFCDESDWSIYYKLIEEMRESHSKSHLPNSEWISWAEGAHLITNNPSGSKTFNEIQSRIAKYFGIEMKSVGTRFNWYRDSTDWKPFHHDSAAFNRQRAQNQNITVGVSFGATRELAFLHAKNGTRTYFPQTNGMLFSFGRDVNINWKHGINALPPEEQDGKGRISIVLWGLVKNVKEEENSPPMIHNNPRERDPYITTTNSHTSNQRRDRDRDRDHSRESCRDFVNGSCRFGDRCRFLHR